MGEWQVGGCVEYCESMFGVNEDAELSLSAMQRYCEAAHLLGSFFVSLRDREDSPTWLASMSEMTLLLELVLLSLRFKGRDFEGIVGGQTAGESERGLSESESSGNAATCC